MAESFAASGESPALSGRLADNVLLFARLLRAAGLQLGTGKILDAIEAVNLVGLESQRDLYTALLSQFVTRHEQTPLFYQAFSLFWRNPKLMEKLMSAMLPTIRTEKDQEQVLRRLGEALSKGSEAQSDPQEQEVELQANLSFSDREVLQSKDFEQMSEAELKIARNMLQKLKLPVPELRSRRFQASRQQARIDMRKTLQQSLRNSATIPLQFKRNRVRPPAIVVLCDISGSMAQYSRMFLHFMHAISNHRDRIHSFVFGTRLTNISRYLRNKDVDIALEATSRAVEDWSGGTRIGLCLEQFNRLWSRRVLSQGAVVILLTDGLDRGEGDDLQKQMDRLSKSCRQLSWLNPLLRYDKFEPKAQGIQSMLPYVDVFRSAHSVDSLAELPALLSQKRKLVA